MSTFELLSKNCKKRQLEYMELAKRYREYKKIRNDLVKIALMMRRHAREWAAMS
ncbi:hypothetical protein [Providencia sp. PROV_01]